MNATEATPSMQANRFTLTLTTLLLALMFLTLPAVLPARAAVDIQEVTSDSGVKAWLVEDYTVPIISVRFAFNGGSTQDPEGKEGVSTLMTGLFDEGAGDLDADAFQERLDEVGAEMSFNATRDAVYGQMRVLEEGRDDAFDLLRLAVNNPRFDQEPVDRIRAQIMTRIQRDMRDPESLGQEEFARALYGDHPYARRSDGTDETLGSVKPEDLKALHARTFARSNVSIGVVGAIDAETLKTMLDKVFGDLPQEPELLPVEHVSPKLDQKISYAYPLPQATIQLVYPGIARDDPEFFPAFLMNHILGGGTFSSRLFDEVREKRGLAYGVGSGLHTGEYADMLTIGTSTRADRAKETLELIRDVVRGMAQEGPTEAELERAKTYLIGAYPINNLDSSAAIARTLVELQLDDRGIDYIDRRVGYINAVTLDQVKAAARRLLIAEPAILVIGPEAADGG
ncbi:M16 family metallopeptidase [Neoaquamicrobium sediminum]|uniref:M16 family metallopeptidase n=1 Tax=Neoaquamicrobium sediminum TaxID=1849104 RepID=UPI001FD564C7|nr:pitrilysin family protein [Mesorhizobium sediminum]